MLSVYNEKNIIDEFEGMSIKKKSSIDDSYFVRPTIIKKTPSEKPSIKREKLFQTCVDITPMSYQQPYNKIKPCNNAMGGFCSRLNCSFAHSIDQLNPVRCSFGDGCYRKNDKHRICTFIHSESISSWITRIGLNVNGLPETLVPETLVPETLVPEMITRSDLKKTKACTSIDCSNSRCSFAHSLTELRDPECGFGNNCNKRSCRFKHPNEDQIQYRSRIGFVSPIFKTEELVVIPTTIQSALIKTKACKNTRNCIHYTLDCTYAHSLAELRDPICIQGEKCKKQKCDYKHPNEDQTQYRERINFIDPFEVKVFYDILPDDHEVIIVL